MSRDNFVIKTGRPSRYQRLPHQSSQEGVVKDLVEISERNLNDLPHLEDRKIEK
jgi:hypothetical protein